MIYKYFSGNFPNKTKDTLFSFVFSHGMKGKDFHGSINKENVYEKRRREMEREREIERDRTLRKIQ